MFAEEVEVDATSSRLHAKNVSVAYPTARKPPSIRRTFRTTPGSMPIRFELGGRRWKKAQGGIGSLVLILLCAPVFAQVMTTSSADMIKSYHDAALDVTYFYPSQFVPSSLSSEDPVDTKPKCIQPALTTNVVSHVDTASFSVSTIDGTCPDVLASAAQLGPYTRLEVLRQLRQYGEASVILEPTRYRIDGHLAAVTLAAVQLAGHPSRSFQAIYAAKACAIGEAQDKKRRKSEPATPTKRVLCFDFTTRNIGQISEMYSFIVQFGSGQLAPVFPGRVIRNLAPGR